MGSNLTAERILSDISPVDGVVEIGQTINGRELTLERTMEVENPGKLQESVGMVADGTAGDVDLAVAAATAAATDWANSPVDARIDLFAKIADAIDERREWMATVVARENGSARNIISGELRACAWIFREVKNYLADKLVPEEYPAGDNGEMVRVERRPYGVIACIVPWNAPLVLTANKIAAALAAGNTIVLKPSPFAPIGSTLIGQIAAMTLPPGVVNVVNGDIEVGETLVGHPDVRMVSFTGGGAVAREIMKQASANLKDVHFELGGNDPAIVLDDADLDVTVERIVSSAFRRAGQVCYAIKRVYVPRALAEEFGEKLAARVDQIIVGDALDERTTMGAVNNRGGFERIKSLVADAKSKGRDVRVLGTQLDPESWEEGYYLRPTLVLDAQQEDELVRQEQFGPVLPVIAYDDEEEAIRYANDSELGLCSSVWSQSTDRAYKVASQLEAGMTIVNNHVFSLTGTRHIPFGGWKQSGMGWEGSPHGIDEYLQYRSFDVQTMADGAKSL